MTLLFAANEDLDFGPSGSPSISTNTSHFRPEYTRCALSAVDTSGTWRCNFSLADELYGQAWVWPSNAPTSSAFFAELLRIIAEDGVSVLRLRAASGSSSGVGFILQWWRWTGSSWSALSGATTSEILPVQVLTRMTWYVRFHGTEGRILLWFGDDLVVDFTGNTARSGVTGYAGFELRMGHATTGSTHWSEVIAATVNPKDYAVKTLVPNAAGAETAWSGGFGDINEVVLNDTTVIAAETADAVSTFGLANLPSDTAAVHAVRVSARARRAGAGAPDLQLVARPGDNHDSGTRTLETDFATVRHQWAANPATSSPWSVAAVNGLEAGVRAIGAAAGAGVAVSKLMAYAVIETGAVPPVQKRPVVLVVT